jgi:hypothetical protein
MGWDHLGHSTEDVMAPSSGDVTFIFKGKGKDIELDKTVLEVIIAHRFFY